MARGRVMVNMDIHKDFIMQLPYGMELKDIKLEPGSFDDGPKELQWMADNVVDDEEATRIFTSTAIIMQVLTPTPNFAHALHTAIVWERG